MRRLQSEIDNLTLVCRTVCVLVNRDLMTGPSNSTVIPARRVSKLIRGLRKLSRPLDRSLSTPPAGWSVDLFDPNVLLDAVSAFGLHHGFRLSVYSFYDGRNSYGLVFAIPLGRNLPELPSLSSSLQLPAWAHADFESFLDGDGSPLSYFEASMFSREVREMGTLRQSASWCNRKVLSSADAPPDQNWRWLEIAPQDFHPVVHEYVEGSTQVVFYTYSGLAQEQIIRHVDIYGESYRYDAVETIAALGEGGYLY